MTKTMQIDTSELEEYVAKMESMNKELSGGRMDPVYEDLNRHLVVEENATLIRERAENAVLRRFKFCGPDPEEFIEAMRGASKAQFVEMQRYVKQKDDTSLGELVRRLTEDQAIEAEIEASDL